MAIYWLLVAVLALGSLVFQPRRRLDPDGSVSVDNRLRSNVAFAAALVGITLLIGFRYKVGGDWNVYDYWFRRIPGWPLSTALRQSPDEIGYTLLNWFVGQLGGQLWLVNLICAVPFVAGLAALCRGQPNPWLALVVAAPLFIIVVGMGYTRQATAAGFLLIGLSGLIEGRSFWWFAFWTLVGSQFHESVLVMLPLVPLFLIRVTALSILLLVAALAIGYFVLLPNALARYSYGYIHEVYAAKGAIFRIAPNAATAVLALSFGRRFEGNPVERKIWRGFAYVALAILAVFFMIRSTTILDRLSVYVLPLQIWVWSRLPTAFNDRRQPHWFLTMAVIAYSAAVLALWLAFANHSKYWLPYQFYPLS